MKPIEVQVDGFPLPKGKAAITLWPFIFYRRLPAHEALRAHELYHWDQARRFFVIPWYICYILLLIIYRTGGRRHPMERRAYQIQDGLT